MIFKLINQNTHQFFTQNKTYDAVLGNNQFIRNEGNVKLLPQQHFQFFYGGGVVNNSNFLLVKASNITSIVR